MVATGSVLITGASGFVGGRLVGVLRAAGVPVIRFGHRDGLDAVCDLRDRDAVTRMVARHAPTVIVHLAAMSSVGEGGRDVLGTWAVNLGGTANLLAAASTLPHPVRLVFASSAEVYGASFLDGPCDEDAPLRPRSTYARSKAAAEWMLHDLASPRLQVLIARPFNHIGPGQDERFVVPSFASQIAASGPGGVVRVGNLSAIRDFSDVADLVDALAIMATGAFDAPLGIFNIGSGQPRSIRSVLERLIALSGLDVRVELDPVRLRSSEVPVARGVFDRFDETFGARTRRPLEDALRAVLARAGATLPR